MDMRDYAGSAFISVDDLRDGPRQETIAAVALGKFDKPNATFESGDQFSLNKTNTRTLINAYGPTSQDWIGCTVELYVGTAAYNKEERKCRGAADQPAEAARGANAGAEAGKRRRRDERRHPLLNPLKAFGAAGIAVPASP